MKVFISDKHKKHAPRMFVSRGQHVRSPELPERADILSGAITSKGYEVLSPDVFGLDPVRRVHDAGYLDFFANAWDLWTQLPDYGDEIIPNAYPNRNMRVKPQHIVGLVGYYMADAGTPVTPGTWEAIQASADIALSAARAVMNGDDCAYALCRPPGHHAYADMAGGFCYLNNTAIAAQYCRDHGATKVATVDVDVHHGNGTQGIFYDRADVLTTSLHGNPAVYYPFFTGYEDEIGEADGQGFNLNLPMEKGTKDDEYLDRLDVALARIRDFAPEVLIVALGLDASEHDGHHPFLHISTEGFRRIAAAIGKLRVPTVLVQEGGYVSDYLGANLVAFLDGFKTGR